MNSIGSILRSTGYDSKLSSPEWQAFARRVRRERGNACEMCKRGHVVTQVHHWFYERNREPWEYRTDEVVVLCHGCHKEIHEHLKQFRKFVFIHLNPQVFKILNGALAVALTQYEPLVFVHALAEFVSTPSLVQRYADAWNCSSVKETEEAKAYRQFKSAMTGDITGQETM